MPNRDDKPEPAPLRQPAGKPSLMDGPSAARPGADGGADNLRMLVELESSARPMNDESAWHAPSWIAALVLVAGAAGGAWWWGQQPAAPSLPATEASPARLIATAPATPTALPVPISAPASAVADAPVARIEAVPESRAAQPVPSQSTAAVVATKPSEPASALPESTERRGANAQPETSTKRSVKPSTKAAALPKHAPTHSAAATTEAGSRPRSTAAAAAAAPAESASGSATASNGSPNRDADIALLTALLAHVSRDSPARPLGTQTQSTIAQIVQRCETRDGKDTKEARDCRRRICDGYWGKAEACPARLAPKKG